MKIRMIKNLFAAAMLLATVVACDGGKDTAVQSQEGSPKDTLQASNQAATGVRIAFIYGDSINASYQFLLDAEAELERESKLIDDRIRRKYERAEKRAAELQKEAPTMGQLEMQEAQFELQDLQIEIQEFQEKLARDFRKREVELQKDYLKRVNEFLEEYNSDGRYDIIMNFQPGGNLLWMSDSFDITADVLAGLNARYKRELAEKSGS